MAKTRKLRFRKSTKNTRKRKNRIQRGGNDAIWKLIIEAYKHCYSTLNLNSTWSNPINLPKIPTPRYKNDPMIGAFRTANSNGVNYPHISKHDRGIQLSVGSGKQIGKEGIQSSSDDNVVVSNFEGSTEEEKIINWLSDCIMYFNEIPIKYPQWIDVLTCMRTYLCNKFQEKYPESTLPVACTAMDTFISTLTGITERDSRSGAGAASLSMFGSDQTSLTRFVSGIKKCDALATLIKNVKAQQGGAESKIARGEIKELFFQIFGKKYSYDEISNAVVGKDMDGMIKNIKEECEAQKTQIFKGEPKKILALIGLFYKKGVMLNEDAVITKVKKALGFEHSVMQDRVKMEIKRWLKELFIPPKGIKFIRNHLLSLLMFLNDSGGFSDNDTLSKANRIKSTSMTSPVFAQIAEIFYTYKWGNAKNEKGKKIFDEVKKKTAEVRVSLEAVDTTQRENVWREHYENDDEANTPLPQLSEGSSWGEVLHGIYERRENEANPPYRIADNDGGGLCLLYSIRDALRNREIDVSDDINTFRNGLIQGLDGYVNNNDVRHSNAAIRTAQRIVISLFPPEGEDMKLWQMSYEDGYRSRDILRNADDPNAQRQEAIRIITFAIQHLADNWTLVAEELFQFINMVAADIYDVTVNIIQQNANGDYVNGGIFGERYASADRQIYLALSGRHYRAIVQNNYDKAKKEREKKKNDELSKELNELIQQKFKGEVHVGSEQNKKCRMCKHMGHNTTRPKFCKLAWQKAKKKTKEQAFKAFKKLHVMKMRQELLKAKKAAEAAAKKAAEAAAATTATSTSTSTTRLCTACNIPKEKTSYSTRQWEMNQQKRCKECIDKNKRGGSRKKTKRRRHKLKKKTRRKMRKHISKKTHKRKRRKYTRKQ
jgi:hypothetical protein